MGEKKYDVAAYIWPAYHADDRAKIFWPKGIGEWESVMSNGPKFDGHQQPRIPLWGFVNEADPYVMEMQINAAADHGVNVFIYDWYWYGSQPYLESCLNEGYLKAGNNDRVKFYIMWANHDVNLTWSKPNADDAFTGKNRAIIWPGAIDRKEFEKICRRFIEKYFSHPSYYKIDGKPVFMIYDMNNFISGLGGIDQSMSALAWFKELTVKNGFNGLELQVSLRRDSQKNVSAIVNDNIGTQAEMVKKLGFDSLTHYQFCHFTKVNRDYLHIIDDVEKEWYRISNEYDLPYYPHVSVGWDSSPRTYNYHGAVTTNNTPENVEKALRQAKKFIDSHCAQAPLITINSWNEWTETSYLQPDDLYGYAYLEAVRNVFL